MSDDIIKLSRATHLLIGGCTGSGKSVLINNILVSLLDYPDYIRLALVDVKKVELSPYRHLKCVDSYADNFQDSIKLLDDSIRIMEARYDYMQEHALRMYEGKHYYIVIDEMADLMTEDKKIIIPRVQKLARLGRAARVHLICATQSPDRTYTLPPPIKLNFTDKIALRCETQIESKQLINVCGAELLPRYGKAYWRSPEGLSLIDIPYISDEAIQEAINKLI